MMKKLIPLLLIFTLFFTACSGENSKSSFDKIQKRGYFIVGVKVDSKPFGFIGENGKNAGFDIDIARQISETVLHTSKVVFVPVTPETRIMKLNSNEVDFIVATMTNTPQRQLVVDFSIPYYFTGLAILVKKGSDIKTASDLDKRRVIVLLSSTADEAILHYAPDALRLGAKNYDEAYNLLKVGKAEAIMADYSILLGIAAKDNNYVVLPKLYSREPYAIALRKGDYDKELRENVDLALESMLSTHNIKALLRKWDLK